MKMQDTVSHGVATLSLSGKIMGGDDSTAFKGRLQEYINQGIKRFIIDLNNVTWTNSSGIGMLVAALASAKKAEGRLVLANITNIQTLLAMTHLIRVFDCYDSLDEAREALEQSAPEAG